MLSFLLRQSRTFARRWTISLAECDQNRKEEREEERGKASIGSDQLSQFELHQSQQQRRTAPGSAVFEWRVVGGGGGGGGTWPRRVWWLIVWTHSVSIVMIRMGRKRMVMTWIGSDRHFYTVAGEATPCGTVVPVHYKKFRRTRELTHTHPRMTHLKKPSIMSQTMSADDQLSNSSLFFALESFQTAALAIWPIYLRTCFSCPPKIGG